MFLCRRRVSTAETATRVTAVLRFLECTLIFSHRNVIKSISFGIRNGLGVDRVDGWGRPACPISKFRQVSQSGRAGHWATMMEGGVSRRANSSIKDESFFLIYTLNFIPCSLPSSDCRRGRAYCDDFIHDVV